MTQRSTAYLKGRFETADVPTQSDYQDVFDSFVNLETSAAQVMAGKLEAPAVSAATVSADAVYVATKTIRSHNVAVSAAGKTQASATRLTTDVSYVFCTNDAERAVVLASAEPGRVQVIVNTAVTALLVFPASGCNFVGTAENGGITLAANGTMVVPHVGASAYGVTRTQGV